MNDHQQVAKWLLEHAGDMNISLTEAPDGAAVLVWLQSVLSGQLVVTKKEPDA